MKTGNRNRPGLSAQGWPAWGLVWLSLTASAYAQTADSFNPCLDSGVSAIAVQPDGRILAGGSLLHLALSSTTVAGTPSLIAATMINKNNEQENT